MIRKYFLRVFCILLWISISFVFSLIFSPKVSAQVCTFQDYSPLVTPDSAYCTGYFPDTIAFPPCNTQNVCSNKAFKAKGAGTVKANCSVGGNVDGTQCCAALNPNYFCDQKDLGAGAITQYEFRCCNIPPTSTPTPTPTATPPPTPTPCSGCTPTPTPVCDSASYLACTSANDMGSSTTKSNMCGDPQHYKISVPAGSQCKIDWTLTNLTADYDLYASWVSGLDACSNDSWDCPSRKTGTNDESCNSGYLPAGTYYAKVLLDADTGKYDIKGEITCRAVPTPTPIPCGDWNNCSSCTDTGGAERKNNCGWTGSACQTGDPFCPAGGSQWYWYKTDCGSINRCAAFFIEGKVFDDKDKDGIFNNNDTAFDGALPGAPNITTSDLEDNLIENKDLDAVGYYKTSSIYKNDTSYVVKLNNVPANCTSSSNPRTTYILNGNATENFPLTCTQPGKVTIKGKHVDVNGALLTTDIGGQQITITGPKNDTRSNVGAWDFTDVPTGTYTVTAKVPANYTVSYSYSGEGISPPTAAYVDDNSLPVPLPNNGNSADIYFKYTPIPPGEVTIQGQHQDSAGVVLANNINIGQGVTITGPDCPSVNPPAGCTNNTSRGKWDFSKIKIGTYTVTAKIPAGYTVSYLLKAGRLDGKDITPDTNYTLGNPKQFALSKDKDYIDIYFKYTLTAACQVTTNPSTCSLSINETCNVTATATNIPAGKSIAQINFVSDNTSIATVNPSFDTSSPYSTTVRAVTAGATVVRGTANLVGGGTCGASGTTAITVLAQCPATVGGGQVQMGSKVYQCMNGSCTASQTTEPLSCNNPAYTCCSTPVAATSTPAPVAATSTPAPAPTSIPSSGNITLIVANPPTDATWVYMALWDEATRQWTDSGKAPTFPFTSYTANITGPHLHALARISRSGSGTYNYSALLPSLSGSVIYFNAKAGFEQFNLTINNFVALSSSTYNLPPSSSTLAEWWKWSTDVPEQGDFNFAGINTSFYPRPPIPSVNIGTQFKLIPHFVNPQITKSDMTLDLLVHRPDGSTFTLGPAFTRIGERDPGGVGGAAYLFTPDQAGTYTGDFTLKANGNTVGSLSNILLLKTPPKYSISGKIFKDVNGDGKSAAVSPLPEDPNYTKQITIGLTGGNASFTVTKNADGTYKADNLPPGQYTITYSGLPPGFTFTYPPRQQSCEPLRQPGNCLSVTVGPSCSAPQTSEASCSSGNIIDLNAGVTGNEAAWFQSVGSDMRWDSGFTNILPSGKHASLLGAGGMPGIIFSGRTSPTFGAGSASQNPFNWQVGSPQNPDVFKAARGLIPTSFRFLLETAQRSGNTPTTITTLDGLTHGIYKTDSDLTINTPVTFGSGNFIILVNGNLNINQEIKVPVGSTAIFSASGNITVSQNVGESSPASTASNIEGLYSADGNFTAGRTGSCPTPSLRLNIAGSVIANAARSGGRFVNNRNLCDDNSLFPSVTFTERPDFILNYPPFVSQTTRTWQNVAP